jgi:hypothetical protein
MKDERRGEEGWGLEVAMGISAVCKWNCVGCAATRNRSSLFHSGVKFAPVVKEFGPSRDPLTRPRPYGPLSGAAKYPAGARPSKCIIIMIP